MELTAMDLRLNTDADCFGFLSQSTDCPSSCSASFSSGSSAGEPFTPTSRRSTPIQFDTNFLQMDGLPYDFTPPSSAMSYLNLDPKSHHITPDLMPVTPRHISVNYSMPPNSGGYHTPSQTLYPYLDDFSSSVHGLQSSPFGISPPIANLPTNAFDNMSIWTEPGSPINLFATETSPVCTVPLVQNEPMTSPYKHLLGSTKRRCLAQDARRSSKALQRVQAVSGLSPASKSQLQSQSRSKRKHDAKCFNNVATAEKGRFRCEVSGCTAGPYRRNEHLKRHQK
jgi:hypothetical protein